MNNTIENTTKEQIIEAVLASRLLTDAELGVKFSDHREFLHIECEDTHDNRTWSIFIAGKKIASDESASPFSIQTPSNWTGTFRRPSCYLGEVLASYQSGRSSDCYSVTHRFKVPHKVFLALLK